MSCGELHGVLVKLMGLILTCLDSFLYKLHSFGCMASLLLNAVKGVLILAFYYCQGRFKYQPGQVRAFGMLAGGSGITPMFQACLSVIFIVSSASNCSLSGFTIDILHGFCLSCRLLGLY